MELATTERLLWPVNPESTRILYLARFAPDDPVYTVKPDSVVSGYAEYHFNLFQALREIGYDVRSSSKPYAAWMAGGNVDFVFSLLNRMPFRNPEIHIPSVCEYLRLPYLGAPPNIRAVAEDKYLSKLTFRALGLPVADGRPYSRGEALDPPDFPGPYFIKDRFGAASEGVTADSLQDSWEGAARIVRSLHDQGRDVLVEAYCPGIDVTVPVIGHSPYLILGHVSPQSDQIGHILTQDLKADDHLGNQLVDVGDSAAAMRGDVATLWRALGPIDYFRVDYRWNPETGRRMVLEINICCYLGKQGALCLAGQQWGVSRKEILAHVVEYSLARQKGAREQGSWIV
jgi:D-alanine-D-alanine ligase